jgi:hypothetical protein
MCIVLWQANQDAVAHQKAALRQVANNRRERQQWVGGV